MFPPFTINVIFDMDGFKSIIFLVTFDWVLDNVYRAIDTKGIYVEQRACFFCWLFVSEIWLALDFVGFQCISASNSFCVTLYLVWGLCCYFFPLFLSHSQISVYLHHGEGLLVLHPQKSLSLFLQYPMGTQITFIQCVRGVHRNRHARWQE